MVLNFKDKITEKGVIAFLRSKREYEALFYSVIIEGHDLLMSIPGAGSETGDFGIKITVKKKIRNFKVVLFDGIDADTAYLYDSTHANILASVSTSAGKATFSYVLEGNTTYYITVKNADNSWYDMQRTGDVTASMPVEKEYIIFVKGWANGADNNTYYFCIKELELNF
jgi:hypothetical protein